MLISRLDNLIQEEEKRLQNNRATFPEHVILIEEIEQCYSFLINEALDLRKLTEKELHYMHALHLIADLPNELLFASLCVLREHFDDCDFHIRKAIEIAGFAVTMLHNPEKASKWRNASDSEAAYIEYRQAFGAHTVFPSTDPTMALLYESYDKTCKSIHATVFSTHSHMQETRKAGLRAFGTSHFTINITNLSFKIRMGNIAFPHLLILITLTQLYKEYCSASSHLKLIAQLEKVKMLADKLNLETNHALGMSPSDV